MPHGVGVFLRWAALLAVLLSSVAGVGRPQGTPALHAATTGLAASPKLDWRGADPGNSGIIAVSGPVVTPTAILTASVLHVSAHSGVQIDGQGDLLVTQDSGQVVALSPQTGTPRWSAALPAPLTEDYVCPAPQPVAGSDGAVYLGDTNGTLYQIDGQGTPTAIYTTPSGAAIKQTAKLAPDGTLWVGTTSGTFLHLRPPAVDSGQTATVLASVSVSGSLQTTAPYSGTHSSAPYQFCGEPALDSAGNAYAASVDRDPLYDSPSLSTLYQITAQGTVGWSAPLRGAVVGAVVVAPNPQTPTQTLVLVADTFPEIAAFDAATGQPVWSFVRGLAPIEASPALSRDGTTLYVATTGGLLEALSVASGTLVGTFGTAGTLAVPGSVTSAPIVDQSGTLYLATLSGALEAVAPSGTVLWMLPGGQGPGQSGSHSFDAMSPALDASGTLWVLDTRGVVHRYQDAGAPSPDSTPATASPPPPSVTPVPSLTPAPSSTAAPLTAAAALPLAFEANRGQADSATRYVAHAAGGTLFLTGTGAILNLPPSTAACATASPTTTGSATATETASAPASPAATASPTETASATSSPTATLPSDTAPPTATDTPDRHGPYPLPDTHADTHADSRRHTHACPDARRHGDQYHLGRSDRRAFADRHRLGHAVSRSGGNCSTHAGP